MLFLSSIVSLKLAFKHADYLNPRRRKTLTMIWLSPLAAACGIQNAAQVVAVLPDARTPGESR